MSHDHTPATSAGIQGQRYAFTEHCPEHPRSTIGHLVKVLNGDNVQKGRWCVDGRHEVPFEQLVIEDEPIADDQTPTAQPEVARKAKQAQQPAPRKRRLLHL